MFEISILTRMHGLGGGTLFYLPFPKGVRLQDGLTYGGTVWLELVDGKVLEVAGEVSVTEVTTSVDATLTPRLIAVEVPVSLERGRVRTVTIDNLREAEQD